VVIVNILIPDDVRVEECGSSGQPVSTNREFLHTPETVDGVHESSFWNHPVSLIRGSHLIHLRVTTDREELPMRLRVGEPRKDIQVDLGAIGTSCDIYFSAVMPFIEEVTRQAVPRGSR
jgi:hypothetical protein